MMRAFTYGSSIRSMTAGVRHQRRVLDQLHRAVGLVDLVLHARHGRDEIEIELALEPLLHDLHVQQAEEAAAEAEAERGRRLRLVVQRRVVELQLLERVAQRLVLLRVRRDTCPRTRSCALPGSRAAPPTRGCPRRRSCRRRASRSPSARSPPRSPPRPARARRSRPGAAGCSRPRPLRTRDSDAPNVIFVPLRSTPSTTRTLGIAPRYLS